MSALGIATAEPFVRPEGMNNDEAIVLVAAYAGVSDDAVAAVLEAAEAAEKDAEAEPADVVYELAALAAVAVEPEAECADTVTALAVVLNHYDATTAANGSKDDAVKDMQALLGCDADGKFGPKTEAALKTFQVAAGLPETGVYTAADNVVLHDDGDHETALIDAILSLMNSDEGAKAVAATVASKPTDKPEDNAPATTATVKPTTAPTATAKPTATTAPTATPKPAATATAKPTAAPTATPKPTATTKPTTAPTATPKPAATATPKPTATPHTHTWTDVTETVQVAEQGHYETVTVVDKAAWDEKVWVVDKAAWTEKVTYIVCSCGATFTSKDEFSRHGFNGTCGGSGYTTKTKEIYHEEQGHYETKHHDAVTHTEKKWVVDVPARTETRVTGQKCKSCGATK